MDRERLKTIPERIKEFSSKITLEGKTYLIEAEDLGIQNHVVVTRVLYRGKIFASYEADYGNILDSSDLKERLADLMDIQQNKAAADLKLDHIEQRKTWRDCIKEVEILMTINNQREALASITRAMAYYPNNPIVCSYMGLLEAVVNRDYSEGIGLCHHAIKLLKESMLLGESFFLPVLYLNLGKAFHAADQRKQAHDSFTKGLEFDNKNKSLRSGLKKLGIRKKPPVPFLKRSSPINRGLGRLIHIFMNE
jgi:tetratricopeptide (TPR) repeat protein